MSPYQTDIGHFDLENVHSSKDYDGQNEKGDISPIGMSEKAQKRADRWPRWP